ncbi:hypothetical protein [Ktedonobacter sp. SOSP1-52]|uniref:hypothetical protein n=1 Tax=Ktedonobacter sp. SOSP1-52 TaxID=2778366 RepID=UPI001915858E|nr:hypothetical protein [Ktedonobacter sp. SOSP1-52]
MPPLPGCFRPISVAVPCGKSSTCTLVERSFACDGPALIILDHRQPEPPTLSLPIFHQDGQQTMIRLPASHWASLLPGGTTAHIPPDTSPLPASRQRHQRRRERLDNLIHLPIARFRPPLR